MKKRVVSTVRKQPSVAAIRRAVASSTAIETGQAVAVLEGRLSNGQSKFRHLKLAS